MPRINQNLDVVAGVANTGTSINKRMYLYPSGGGRWFDNERVICQLEPNFDPAMAHLLLLDKLGNTAPIDSQGANFISAGAGIYCASLNGLFRSSIGPMNQYYGVGDTGFDGWSIIKERYHDDLPGKRVLIIDPAGTIMQGYETTGTHSWCIRNKDEFCWHEMDGFWHNPAVMDLHYPAHNLRMWQGYVLYNNLERLIFHHIHDKTKGYIFSTNDRSYNPDFIIKNGILHYTYSMNLGESPDAVVIENLSLTTPMVPLVPEPEEPMKKPEITVSVDNNWPGMTPNGCKNGQIIEFFDRENFPNQEQKIRVIIRDGSMYLEIHNEMGVGKTGRYRPVKLG